MNVRMPLTVFYVEFQVSGIAGSTYSTTVWGERGARPPLDDGCCDYFSIFSSFIIRAFQQ
jgi:hypothetical protein